MKLLFRVFLAALGVMAGLVALVILGIWLRHGGGELFEDRTSDPLLPITVLEKVADLDLPPGNIAVSTQGRVFFTFHPEAFPEVKVAELIHGKAAPYPDQAMQGPGGAELHFQSVLSVRIDRQDRLWALDYGDHGLGQPRLLAFDLATDQLIHRHDFPAEVAPLGSHLNDFQVNPAGTKIYIADASIFGKQPAIVVYDIPSQSSRRVLEGHPSVSAEKYAPVVQGQKMVIFGIFAIRPGVDSIALDRKGEWLYYAPVTNEHMYRIRTRLLDDARLSAEELASSVETFALKTMSDGLTTDLLGNVYLTDLEHSAIVTLGPDKRLRTLLKHPLLRWPDGLGFGPDGWLYIACSSLHHVIMRSAGHIRANAPYQIFRFKPGPAGIPGH
jgi:sugar lactone lactonase YvrE